MAKERRHHRTITISIKSEQGHLPKLLHQVKFIDEETGLEITPMEATIHMPNDDFVWVTMKLPVSNLELNGVKVEVRG